MTRFPRLALVDWGIGGLGVRAALATVAPGASVAYLSDTEAIPYGKLSRPALVRRLAYVVEALARKGAKEVFLACNAASTVLPGKPRFALPTRGMIEPAVACVDATIARRIGLVGGARTIRSGVFRRALSMRHRVVTQRIAQPVSAAVESGLADAESTRELVRSIVAPLIGIDALLLACTHYPAAIRAFELALPGVMMLDPAPHAARLLVPSVGDRVGDDVLLTTGDPAAMRRGAASAFGLELGEISRVNLDD